ncbi:unnamed protein product [Ranitomeya imitator]|uniref:LIM zinc-binding domain-containing protein n=1 Tax=Ranitomeya imitator TaxID=111125 RepID=A0ABN9KS58_9NEOB|nr:unnamed protein product [Ranitomeya imitator]
MTLDALARNPSITIKPADKGGAVVVMDSMKYKAEIQRQLADSSIYAKLPGNPTSGFQRELQLVVSDSLSMGLIDHKLSEFLIVDFPVTPLRGTAMGSNVAPTYANIFMAVLEDKFVYSSILWRHVRAWWRYIDDIFVIWEVCGSDLAQGGFFVRQGDYICTLDYQKLYGTRCFSCDQFIEGEVVSALGKTYHPCCFVCAICKSPFPPGDRVTFNGKECVCQKCTISPTVGNSNFSIQSLRNCGGCGLEIKNGQSLVALEKHWHLDCFKCKTCGVHLKAEYISKDGIPYCEMDYHAMFGIKCDHCEKFITGRVLEAGEKHYHPTCARCVRCNQMFAEGEEMYLQGNSIWHPICRQAAKTEERNKETRTSSESIISVPTSNTSGSPSRVIYAKLGDEIIDYKDLAALPKDKAIYNIDRPDMISYSPYISYSTDDRHSYGEVLEMVYLRNCCQNITLGNSTTLLKYSPKT